MKSLIISGFFLFSAVTCFSQNKTTADGLRIGKWVNEYETDGEQFKETGYYKVISLDTHDTIGSLVGSFFQVRYKNSTGLLIIAGQHNNLIAVKDSIWHTVDSKGRLYKTNFWINGLYDWTKDFDKDGNLVYHHYTDYENDTSFYLSYIDNRLFRKAYYPPKDKNNRVELFYPNDGLIISDADIFIYTPFGATVDHPLKITCKKKLSIISAHSESGNIEINSSLFPLDLTPGDTTIFHLLFNPAAASFSETDTILIRTSEPDIPAYKIYCSLGASHIDGWNVEKLHQLTLSKKGDKYLVVAPMGSQTDVFITDSKNTEKTYQIYGITKIPLKSFKPGVYDLKIASCNTGGFISLKITD